MLKEEKKVPSLLRRFVCMQKENGSVKVIIAIYICKKWKKMVVCKFITYNYNGRKLTLIQCDCIVLVMFETSVKRMKMCKYMREERKEETSEQASQKN